MRLSPEKQQLKTHTMDQMNYLNSLTSLADTLANALTGQITKSFAGNRGSGR